VRGATVKNIQVIDGAVNCTFSIFQATDQEFAVLFTDGALPDENDSGDLELLLYSVDDDKAGC
jgi:hypothetical protein